jgi:AraC family transcriptional regulator
VERAALLLRGGRAALAEVAVAAGFCDQSHMNRAFRAVLGRTPLEVRREAVLLGPLAVV